MRHSQFKSAKHLHRRGTLGFFIKNKIERRMLGSNRRESGAEVPEGGAGGGGAEAWRGWP